MLAGAGNSQLLNLGGAGGVVDTILAGVADLNIIQGNGGVVVHALTLDIGDGEVREGGLALIIIDTVVGCAVNGDIRSGQHTVVVQTVILGVGHGCGIQHQRAIVLNAVAFCAGVHHRHIGGGHGGLVVDAVLAGSIDGQAVDGHLAADLIIDTVHAGSGNGDILHLHNGDIVDALLAHIGNGHILQHQLLCHGDSVEAVGDHGGKGTVLHSQRTGGHIGTVVAHILGIHAGDRGGAGLMLDGVLLDGIDGQAFHLDIAAIVVYAMATHVSQGHIFYHDTAAIGLEAVLLHILDGHIVQLDVAAGVSLDSGGGNVLHGAVAKVKLAAEDINAVLLAAGAVDGNIVQHSLAVAHSDRLVTANIQHSAIDGQVAACDGNIAVTAAADCQVLQFHITGEVVDRAGVALLGSELLCVDLAAVVGKTVDLAGIHGGALDIQLGTVIVHDAALTQQHGAGIGSAVVAQAMDTVGDLATGDISSGTLGYHDGILGSTGVDTAGHGEGAGGHIDIVERGAGYGAAGLGQLAGGVNGSTALSAGNRTADQGQLAVVDHIVDLSRQQLAAVDGDFSTLSHHKVGIAAVFNLGILGQRQLCALFHQNAVGVAAGIDGGACTQGQTGACGDPQGSTHGACFLSLQLGAADTPGGLLRVGPGAVHGGIQQDGAVAGNGFVAIDDQLAINDHILLQLYDAIAFLGQSLGQLTGELVHRWLFTVALGQQQRRCRHQYRQQHTQQDYGPLFLLLCLGVCHRECSFHLMVLVVKDRLQRAMVRNMLSVIVVVYHCEFLSHHVTGHEDMVAVSEIVIGTLAPSIEGAAVHGILRLEANIQIGFRYDAVAAGGQTHVPVAAQHSRAAATQLIQLLHGQRTGQRADLLTFGVGVDIQYQEFTAGLLVLQDDPVDAAGVLADSAVGPCGGLDLVRGG